MIDDATWNKQYKCNNVLCIGNKNFRYNSKILLIAMYTELG